MTINLALELLISLLAQSQEISQLIAKARAAGSEELTKEDWDVILLRSNAARQKLVEALETAGE
jgi:hypothetical protein